MNLIGRRVKFGHWSQDIIYRGVCIKLKLKIGFNEYYEVKVGDQIYTVNSNRLELDPDYYLQEIKLINL